MVMNFKRLVILMLLVIFGDILDLFSTHLATPDLSREYNLLVRDFGWGWSEIAGLHMILLSMLCLFLLYHVRNEPNKNDAPPGNSLKKVCSWYVFGLDESHNDVNASRYIGFLGLVIPLGAALNGFINFVLNISFYLGYFGGLNETTLIYFGRNL